MSRKTPYGNLVAPAVAPAVVDGLRPSVDPDWHPTISQLMTSCWDRLPADRISIAESRYFSSRHFFVQV